MSKTKYHVAAVIFDMDGVITNTMPDHYRCWKSVMSRAGIAVTYEDIYAREGQPGIQSVREIFRKYGRPYEMPQARQILAEKEELFKQIGRRRFIIGARSFLKKLHRQNFKLALVTGTARHELQRILPGHLYELFDVIVTGNDVRHGKPHPEPYRQALKRLRLTSQAAVAIENAPFGIRSAKRAGLRCLALETSLPRRHLVEADAVFGSIREMENNVHFIPRN